MQMFAKLKVKRGFSLIELVVIIAIIAILIGIMVPSLTAYKTKADDTVTKANLKTFYNGAELVDKTDEINFPVNTEADSYFIEKAVEYSNVKDDIELNKFKAFKVKKGIYVEYHHSNGKIYKYPDWAISNAGKEDNASLDNKGCPTSGYIPIDITDYLDYVIFTDPGIPEENGGPGSPMDITLEMWKSMIPGEISLFNKEENIYISVRDTENEIFTKLNNLMDLQNGFMGLEDQEPIYGSDEFPLYENEFHVKQFGHTLGTLGFPDYIPVYSENKVIECKIASIKPVKPDDNCDGPCEPDGDGGGQPQEPKPDYVREDVCSTSFFSYNYNDVDNTASITGFTDKYKNDNPTSDDKGTVFIPDNITCDGKKYNVTSVGEKAFMIEHEEDKNNAMNKVYLSKTITKIDDNAFYGNNLGNLSMPENLIEIGNFAFYGNKIRHLDFKDSLIEMGQGAFQNNLIYHIALGKGLDKINHNAFQENLLAGTVRIPSNIKMIGERAFEVNKITSIEFSEGLEEIYSGAFDVNRLTELKLPNTLKILQEYSFYDNSDWTTNRNSNKITKITIGPNVNIQGDILGYDWSNFKKTYDNGGKKSGVYIR